MAIESTMTMLGSTAPAFDLPTANPEIDDIDRPTRAFSDYPDAHVFVVVFTCNHCPYAVHVEKTLVDIANMYAGKGVQFIAICSNDATTYPDDSFDNMKIRAQQVNMPFPYLHDESQAVARAYDAACTPDLFVYNTDKILKYRGRVDETRPGGSDAHGGELKAALDIILKTGETPEMQYPSIGCSIKWRG